MLSMLYYCTKDSTKTVTPPAIQVSLPIVTTTSASTVTATGATLGGNVTSDGNATVTERGVVYATTQNPTTSNTKIAVGTGIGTFTTNITGLTAGTAYYVRSYATNSQGTAYGSQETFATTLALSPAAVTTTPASTITSTGTTLGGNVTSDGNATVTERGVVYATTQNPTTSNTKVAVGTGTGSFTTNITGLTAGTTYYVRGYATNSQGTVYGNQVTFTTTSGYGTSTVTDIDGNVYKTITIGTQVWMAENLKTTKYRNGTSIPNVTTGNDAWLTLTSGAYCNYNNDANNATTYGRLYNWYAVNTGNLAPTGWHVPTDAEWTTLTTYLTNNGFGYQGSGSDIAKSLASTSGWISSSIYADSPANDQTSNNSSGFTALPGGKREGNGTFYFIGDLGYWWSSTEFSTDYAWYRYLHYDYGYVYRLSDYKGLGFAVRCVRD